jgi:hypothetical protein
VAHRPCGQLRRERKAAVLGLPACLQKAVAEVRLALGEDAFTEAERRGRAMSEAEAVAFARNP